VSERNGGVGSGSAFGNYHNVSDKNVVMGESKIVCANACAWPSVVLCHVYFILPYCSN